MATPSIDALLAEAQQALQAGDYATLRDRLKQAMTLDPQNFQVWLLATYATNNPAQQRQFIDRAKQIKRLDARILAREKELFPEVDNGFSFTPDTPPQSPPVPTPKPVTSAAPKQVVLSPSDHIPTIADRVRVNSLPLRFPPIMLIPIGIIVVVGVLLVLFQGQPTNTPSAVVSTPGQSSIPMPTLDATQIGFSQTATALSQTQNAMLLAPTLTATYLAPAFTQTALVFQQNRLNTLIAATQTQAVVSITQTALVIGQTTSTPVAQTQIAGTATQGAAAYKGTLRGKLATAKTIAGHGLEIVVLNADGSNLTPLNILGIDPAWSPDGQRLAYTNREHRDVIHLMNADGSGDMEVPISDALFGSSWVSWSADGRHLMLDASTRLGLHAVYISNPDGSNATPFLDDTHAGDWTSWSPDGKQAMYSKDDQVWVINADGSALHSIVTQTGARAPVWSPDGKQIAFEAGNDQSRGLYLMNTDGSGLHRLTPNSLYITLPTWSLDGKRLVALCNGSGGYLCVMDTDSTHLTTLTDKGFDGRIAWTP